MSMRQSFAILLAVAVFPVLMAAPAPAASHNEGRDQINSYAELVYRNYLDAYVAGVRLQQAVNQLVTPAAGTASDVEAYLQGARAAWLASRPIYGQTEAFRFYEGPIDFGQRPDGQQGPELQLNSWPVNEAYIDYVQGDPDAGIINDSTVPITRATLVERNARDDEADVTTGFHAIEFLLWGQDLDENGPGNRSASDFVGTGAAARRREYLRVATDLLVGQLKSLVDAWAPGKHNYRAEFIAKPRQDSISNMLTGVATLSGFELGYERLATALDSGSQEDEHSCFSDSTHLDVLANVTGIANVYFGRYGKFQGNGLNTLVRAANPVLDDLLQEQLQRSMRLAQTIHHPFDQILRTPPGSPQRATVEALIVSLQTQARLFIQAGRSLGVKMVVAVEDE